MMNLAEYRNSAASLADYLPWAALVAPGVILNKDGSFQRTARFRGLDLEAAASAELDAATARMNAVLRRLGSGWAVFAEAQRRPAIAYPQSEFADAVSRLVDEERRAGFDAQDAHFETRTFLTFVYLPPAERRAGLVRWLYEGAAAKGLDWRAALATFRYETDRLLDLVQDCAADAAWLSDRETLGYLASTVSNRAQGVAVPETPMHLDVLLARETLTGGLEPRLGASHLRVLTITGLPNETWPGVLDELGRLPFAARWCVRAIGLDKLEAARLATRIRRQWFAKRKSIAVLFREVLTSEPAALVDTDAENKAADADAALQDLGGDEVSHAYVTATVVVTDETPEGAQAKLRAVEKIVRGRDCLCRAEAANAVEAWLGSIPGHAYANVRQPPISTLNLAHLLPLSAAWAGPDRNPHLDGPALLQARTEGSTPFRLSLHVGDVGHTLVVGPTGAGKSVLLALLALQFRRYRGNQVFAFDFGGSIRAATLAMGGEFQDLGAGETRLQPLAAIDRPEECAWAAAWLESLLVREGLELSAPDRQRIWEALISLAGAPLEERTISGFSALVQSGRLRDALAPYLVGGAFGRLLDAEFENLAWSSVCAFETEGLMGSAAAPAVLDLLFHRIEERLQGRPTLILVDEGWLALSDATFGPKLREWLKTLRKKNASVVFATQSLADLEASPLAAPLVESCLSRLFLPNVRAQEPGVRELYERFGLNARQLEILACATPKRDYFYTSPDGVRLFDLELGPIALAICAASGPAEQAAISETLHAAGREGFAAAWLRRRGLPWAADLVTSFPEDRAVAPLMEPMA